MYLTMVLLLMVVFPIGFLVGEAATRHGAVDLLPLIGKWFVFWGVGARFFLAGLRQCTKPGYTSEVILGIHGTESHVLVRELGFANLGIGTIALGSLLAPGWVLPAAVAGAVFIGLAGLNHLRRKRKGWHENVALYSNLFLFVVPLIYPFHALTR